MAGTPAVDREMFALMWSPTVAAVSVVLDHAEDVPVVRLALDGLLCAARLASYHRLDQVCAPAHLPVRLRTNVHVRLRASTSMQEPVHEVDPMIHIKETLQRLACSTLYARCREKELQRDQS